MKLTLQWQANYPLPLLASGSRFVLPFGNSLGSNIQDARAALSCLPAQYWNFSDSFSAATDNPMKAPVANPFNGALGAIQSSNPTLYNYLSNIGMFTSTTLQVQQLLGAYPNAGFGLQKTDAMRGKVVDNELRAMYQKRWSRGVQSIVRYAHIGFSSESAGSLGRLCGLFSTAAGKMAGVLTSNLLSQLSWAEHGFGMRDSVYPEGLVTVKQIHSGLTLVADRAGGSAGEGDALIANRPGIGVSIRTADCLPILLADPHTRSVAAIHAGWRGSAAHIARETVERMRTEFGCRPSDVRAAIGPGIGVCCYKVGEEVAREFGFRGTVHLDLAAENRQQLLAAGVLAENVEALGICTFCDAKRFYSYRRENEQAGRMVSFIRILAAG